MRLPALVALALLVVLVPPSAAGAAGDPGTLERLTYGSGPSTYSYLVYVPASVDPATPAPLYVMVHGCQTTAEQQMRANLLNPIAERERFIVLYPDVSATHEAQPGPLKRCWQFPLPTSWRRDSGDAAAIAGMTRAVMERRRVDPERVYVQGMSAGAFMTSIMAAAYPDLYAAVGINAGGAYADGTCLGQDVATVPVSISAQNARNEMGARARVVPRLVMGGDADLGIPAACADKALQQGLRTNNLVLGSSQEAPIALEPKTVRREPKPGGGRDSTVSTYVDPDGCLIAERWLIHGMNHFWPGGSDDPELAGFTDPKGPNGSEISWAFFKRFTRSSTAMPCAEAPLPAPAAPTACRARWLTLRFTGRTALRARVNGRAVAVRRSGRRVRVRLPAGRRSATSVVLRGRSAGGRAVSRRVVRRGCV